MAHLILPDQAYLVACFSYDRETGALVWRYRPREHFASTRAQNVWNARFPGTIAGKVSEEGYINIYVNGKAIGWLTNTNCLARFLFKEPAPCHTSLILYIRTNNSGSAAKDCSR